MNSRVSVAARYWVALALCAAALSGCGGGEAHTPGSPSAPDPRATIPASQSVAFSPSP